MPDPGYIEVILWAATCPLCEQRVVQVAPSTVEQAYHDHLKVCPIYQLLNGLPGPFKEMRAADVHYIIKGKYPKGYDPGGE